MPRQAFVLIGGWMVRRVLAALAVCALGAVGGYLGSKGWVETR